MRFPPILTAPRLALSLSIFILAVGPTWATNPSADFEALQRASLKGIDSVGVVVMIPRTVPGCDPLSPQQIQTDVTARLHRPGVPTSPDPAAFLSISVTAVAATENLLCGFAVSVDLYQIVFLVRDIRIASVGVTWHQGALGVVARTQTPAYLQKVLAILVEHFIAAYLEQNPTM